MLDEITGDTELIRRAILGDQEAFGVLVARHCDRLFRQASRFTRSAADAEDVVQETFLRAYQAIKDFRGETLFSTWIYSISQHVATANYCQNKTYGLLYTSDICEDNATGISSAEQFDVNTPEAILECKQITNAISTTLAGLPEGYQWAYALREIHKLTYDEIADRMACPIGTVRSRIFRARAAIASCLVECGHFC